MYSRSSPFSFIFFTNRVFKKFSIFHSLFCTFFAFTVKRIYVQRVLKMQFQQTILTSQDSGCKLSQRRINSSRVRLAISAKSRSALSKSVNSGPQHRNEHVTASRRDSMRGYIHRMRASNPSAHARRVVQCAARVSIRAAFIRGYSQRSCSPTCRACLAR